MSTGGQQQQPQPNNWWGGQQMRWGGPIGDPNNYMYAQQNLPGATTPNLLAASALYGTPWQGQGVGSYGRWNWAQGMGQGQQGQPQAPGTPQTPYTPPPATGGTTPPPAGYGGGTAPGTNPSTGSRLFGLTPDQQASQPLNPGAPTGGDIFSNPAFANAASGTGGGGLFGTNYTPPPNMNPAPDAATRAARQQQAQMMRQQAAAGQGGQVMGADWWNAVKGLGK